jgi:hypothetical protein
MAGSIGMTTSHLRSNFNPVIDPVAVTLSNSLWFLVSISVKWVWTKDKILRQSLGYHPKPALLEVLSECSILFLTGHDVICNLCFSFILWRHYPANACLTPICSLYGTAVTTVEGIGSTKTRIHPIQVRVCLLLYRVSVIWKPLMASWVLETKRVEQ